MIIRLKLIVGSGLSFGDHVNLAHAEDFAGTLLSNIARSSVTIVPDPVLDCSALIGKVWDDKNRNGRQDEGEKGLAGVKLATVNGFVITTDQHGRYHFPCAVIADFQKGSNFILKVDPGTLPSGYHMTTENPRVIRMRRGRMGKINFGATLPPLFEVNLGRDGLNNPKRVILALERAIRIARRQGEYGTAAIRFTYHGGSIAGPRIANRLFHLANLTRERWSAIAGQLRLGEISMEAVTDQTVPVTGLSVSLDGQNLLGNPSFSGTSPLRPEMLVKFNSRPEARKLNVTANLAKELGDRTLKFKGYWNYGPWIDRAEIRLFSPRAGVLTRPDAIIALNSSREAKVEIPIIDGNRIKYVLRVYDAAGRFDETRPKDILIRNRTILSGNTGVGGDAGEDGVGNGVSARNQQSTSGMEGFGRNTIRISNILLDTGTITVSGAQLPPEAQITTMGQTVPADRNGKVVIEQLVRDKGHIVDIIVRSGGRPIYRIIKGGATAANDFFFVAIGDLTLGRDRLKSGSRKTTNKYTDGRAAFYFKGKVKGNVLITAMADARDGDIREMFGRINNRDPRKFLRRLDPDKFYPVYGDDSTIREDAPTSGRLYLRVQQDQSYGVWGNFRTNFNDTEYGRTERALYGAKVRLRPFGQTSFGEPTTEIKAFAANPDTQSERDELRGTGGSIYHLRRSDLLVGSERLRIEIRDQNSGIVISSKRLVAGQDYDIDYVQGRVVLNTPLASTAQNDSLFLQGTLSGDRVYLIAEYEFVAVAQDTTDMIMGARLSHWINDHLKVGGTILQENASKTGTMPFELRELDVTLRYRPGTYVKIEWAETEGLMQSAFTSIDGGYSFAQKQIAGSVRKATGWAAELAVDLSDVTDNAIEGSIVAYFRDRDAGFAALGYETIVATTQYGAKATVKIAERTSLKASFDANENAAGLGKKRTEVALAHHWNDNWETKVGVANEQTSNRGDRSFAAVKLIYHFDKEMNVYIIGQTRLDTNRRSGNGQRGGAGAQLPLTEKITLKGEVTGGDGGLGARAGIRYKYDEKNELYIAYELPDRTNTGTAVGNLILGARKRYSDTLSVFGEERLRHNNAGVTGLTHAYGIDYRPTKNWNLNLLSEVGKVNNLDRVAVSGTVGYKTLASKIGATLEYRTDKVNLISTRDTYAGRLAILHKPYESLRLQAKLNTTLSESSQSANGAFDARFFEGSVGAAYRPIWNDKLNLLAKYTYLYDLPASQQVNGSALGLADYRQRSHILSVDAILEVNQWLSVGAKYGWKLGEQTGSRTTNDWFRSSAHLMSVGADIHLPFKWDIYLEGRILHLPEADETAKGFTTGIYRQVGKQVKIGGGYHFGEASANLANPQRDQQGWFVNVISKF